MIGVKVSMSAKRAERGLLGRAKFGAEVAIDLAKRLRRRVEQRGDTVQGFSGYARGHKRLVSPRYPASGGRDSPSGAQVFESSATFHAAAGGSPGSFSTSGGMWDGMTVVVTGKGGRIRFRGRSEGQDPNFRRYASGKVKARGKKVSNALKAASILKSVGVNVLTVTRHDLDAARRILEVLVAQVVARQLPARVDWRRGLPMRSQIGIGDGSLQR